MQNLYINYGRRALGHHWGGRALEEAMRWEVQKNPKLQIWEPNSEHLLWLRSMLEPLKYKLIIMI